ncbi:Putative WD40 repeat [Penicillium brasilianum]|uniref:Mitochondrial division protein 1 n=1 Tax=Penicillium brasilianum TaxID=104259 RepID=A0A0F7TSR6_PENBI|nr:Putative WD40 repeat [Penicillium brasilianum]
MARMRDLIRDSKLETEFLLDETVHRFQESDPISGRRLVTRSEHWRRQKRIGFGGFGSVWLEICNKGGRQDHRNQDGRAVRAVKQIDIDMQFGSIDYSRELEAIAKFSHSRYERCFVKSFGWYEAPGQLFIAMEYLELGDLFTYLYRKPPIPPLSEMEAKELAYQILEGVNMMHENGFAHRDLKPNNILIKSHPPNEWWIKLADFGLTKRIDEAYGQSTRAFQGTPRYCAPELWGYIARGSAYATDIWVLGEIVSEILTKKPTFTNPGQLSTYINQQQFPVAQLATAGIKFASWNTKPSSRGRSPVVGRTDSVLPRVEERSRAKPQVLKSHSHDVQTVAFSPDDRMLASDSNNKAARLSDPASALLQRTIKHSSAVFSVAFSPDSRLLACSCDDGTVRLWKTETGALHRTLRVSASVSAVDFSPDGQLLACIALLGSVHIWDTATGALRQTLQDTWCSSTVAFSRDGRCLASDHGNSVRLRDIAKIERPWNRMTGTLYQTLEGHSGSVQSVVFSPDGWALASGSHDRTVRVWDTATGALRQILKGHSDGVYSVAFSPDGRLLASSSLDNTVRLWALS